ncbi:MAG: cysteine desulfurase [Pseudopedobacter saltans]|uniref:cysteine desulfurase n=1 Tax=Pseudopedobacter saltans TaxID=151895 RepID=A0A2W5F184_9SPHI|nr:MAG: cysteine desulfurase [Pseudopedobacter saltans]
MSTNNNIPDVALIEKIANDLFSGNSWEQPVTQQPTHSELNKQQLGLGGSPGGVPASVTGEGISPSAINQKNAVDLSNPQTSFQDPHVTSTQIPASVAGVGVSPETASHLGKFNLGDSQASLFNHQNSNQPSAYQAGIPNQSQYFGWEEISPFQQDLDNALRQVQSYVPESQIPISHTPSLSQFYFSPDFSQLQSGGITNGFNGISPLDKPPFDVNIIKNDFPILSEIVNGRRLVWLDNAATTQKPRQVIDRLSYFYEHENSNVHRGAHTLAARSTDAYEEARTIVKEFINARSTNEIVFVRGTTEAINLIAQSWGDQNLNNGDEIIVSYLEHHANIVPWQLLAQKKGLKLKVIPVDDNGELLLDEFTKLLTPRTKLISVTAVSNALGTVNPIKKIVEIGHSAGAKVLIDGAQSISHIRTDVQDLDADWFVFSGHKIYGPTGIGVVYGKESILNATQPWQGGGNMIKDVTFEHTEFHPAPGRFEAGTGNIGDAVGLGAALKYVSKLGIDLVHQYETALIQYATEKLKPIPGLHIIGNAKEKAGAISFVLDGFETVKIGGLLSKVGIAVRAGHHCAQPILRRFGVEATVRPSFAFYNTCSDIDALVEAVQQIKSGHLS